MADINKFIERMRYWCNDGNLGYDQLNRWDIRYGGECDCSSLVIYVLRDECCFDTGSASYTGNMSSELCARGWQRVANDGNPQPGDILLNDANHTAVYLGNGQLAQASCGEQGHEISGGEAGDQANETNVRSYYDYPWDCYLRYTGSPQPQPSGNEGWYTCVCDCCNVRTQPNLLGEVVAQYHRGEQVYLNGNTFNNDGYVWGEYTGASSGQLRYVALYGNGDTMWQKD